MRCRSAGSGRRAFTLVELLIVIGIIALLVAILLPALSGARKQAQMIKCQNNMRQLMIAVVFYENDNNQFLPFANWGVPGSSVYDYGWLYRTSTCTGPSNANHTGPTALPTDVQDGVLYKYVSGGAALINDPSNPSPTPPPLLGPDVFHCPLYDPATAIGVTNTITSYTMDGASVAFGALEGGKGMPSYKITQITNTSEKVLLWEGDERPGTAAPFNDGASFPYEESLATRHGTGNAQAQNTQTNAVNQSGLGANLAYLDSHVEFMTSSAFLADSSSTAPNGTTGPNELYWNPNTATGH